MDLSEAILKAAGTAKRLPCAAAMAVAERGGADPMAVGAAADEAGVRISRCQLGLFGYGEPHTPGDKHLGPSEQYPPTLTDALEEWRGQRLPCAEAWRIAERTGVDRQTLGSASNSLNVKITACQLGCFGRCK